METQSLISNPLNGIVRLRQSSLLIERIALVLTIACLTGLMAQIKISLFFTPVPVTGQTFAVLLFAVLFGVWGGIGQAVYALLGSLGVPWFSSWQAGVGLTFGYVIGFILASFFISYFINKQKSFIKIVIIISLANFVFIHGLGLLWLYFWFKSTISFYSLLMLGSFPFVVGDVVKIFLAALIAKEYNYTVDKELKIDNKYINDV